MSKTVIKPRVDSQKDHPQRDPRDHPNVEPRATHPVTRTPKQARPQ